MKSKYATALYEMKTAAGGGKTLEIVYEALELCDKLVHCKDCAYWQQDDSLPKHVGICGEARWLIGPEGYCTYGKRRE